MAQISAEVAAIRQLPQLKTLKPIQKRLLLHLLSTNLKVEPAAIAIGIEPKTHYNWLEKPVYKQAYEYIKKIWGDCLYTDMADDAIQGQEKPIIYRGEITGYYREKNTREREILVKGFFPELRDNYNQLGSAAPIQLSIVHHGQTIDITPQHVVISPPTDDDKA